MTTTWPGLTWFAFFGALVLTLPVSVRDIDGALGFGCSNLLKLSLPPCKELTADLPRWWDELCLLERDAWLPLVSGAWAFLRLSSGVDVGVVSYSQVSLARRMLNALFNLIPEETGGAGDFWTGLSPASLLLSEAAVNFPAVAALSLAVLLLKLPRLPRSRLATCGFLTDALLADLCMLVLRLGTGLFWCKVCTELTLGSLLRSR